MICWLAGIRFADFRRQFRGVYSVALLFLCVNSQLRGDEQQDLTLRQLLSSHSVGPLAPQSTLDSKVVDLGKSLFFDPVLSGNQDIACASCHHPAMASGDGRSLSSGTDGQGLGPDRTQDEGSEIVPRNAPDVFSRGDSQWTSMFWDSRVSQVNGEFSSPAGADLPDGLNNVLAVQAMFPVTSRTEMRGNVGDHDVNGQPNEIAAVDDDNLPGIWNALMDRLMSIPAYREAFQEAYPNVSASQFGFQEAANAIAAFEATAFSVNDTQFDRYLSGDSSALTAAAKRGATHFYSGNCASCHSGSLMTDQQHHNLAVPQIGPGKDPVTQLDPGRELVTGSESDESHSRPRLSTRC